MHFQSLRSVFKHPTQGLFDHPTRSVVCRKTPTIKHAASDFDPAPKGSPLLGYNLLLGLWEHGVLPGLSFVARELRPPHLRDHLLKSFTFLE